MHCMVAPDKVLLSEVEVEEAVEPPDVDILHAEEVEAVEEVARNPMILSCVGTNSTDDDAAVVEGDGDEADTLVVVVGGEVLADDEVQGAFHDADVVWEVEAHSERAPLWVSQPADA
jgi:hypothetical protein